MFDNNFRKKRIYQYKNPKIFNIKERENSSLFKNFKKEISVFKCNIHGLHNKWRLVEVKDKYKQIYKYLLCKICEQKLAREHYEEYPIYHLNHYTKKRAKKLNKAFDLNENIILDKLNKQKNLCALSGIKLDWKKNKPSLDRIDSSKGYSQSNIQLVLFDINTMKTNNSDKKFVYICNLVANPIINKGSLRLLKNAHRARKKQEIIMLRKKFIRYKKVLCYVHGIHSEWEIYNNGRYDSIRCKKCFKKREIKSINYGLKKLNSFKLGKSIKCPLHGTHLNFRISLDKRDGKEYLRCKKCQISATKKSYENNIFSSLYYNTQISSRRYNTKMTLTYEELLEQYIKQKGKCNYSNITFTKKQKPSIDKIDPKKGYTKSNIQLILYSINQIKNVINHKKFLFYCKKVYKNSYNKFY